ncbi:MAG: putative glycoside hydrolase [Bacillota bacterium]|nr:putative glycoside hydrolase [Bacillota bacterium]
MIKVSRTPSLIVSIIMILSILTSCANTSNQDKNNNPKQNAQGTKVPGSSASDKTSQAPSQSPTAAVTPTSQTALNHVAKPDKLRAFYFSGWTAGNPQRIKQVIELAKTTDLNAVVIDIKDDNGTIGYKTDIQDVKDNGAVEVKFDVDKVIKQLHEGNVFVIGRLVCFKDPILPKKHPELAFKKKDGSIWRDNIGRAWVNPFNQGAWDYNIKIAQEAIDKGFDGIQFDYVRFCNDGDIKKIYFGENFDPSTKSDAISGFLKKSYEEIHNKKGAELSADVFGISAVATADDKIIGQNWEKLAANVDYLSPMVYPSHYATIKQNNVGQEINGVLFTKPDLEPYNVIYQTLLSGDKRLKKANIKVNIRPYLQAFTAPWLGKGYYQKYGTEQVKQQIKAVYDAGYTEWILWDPANNYPLDCLEKK